LTTSHALEALGYPDVGPSPVFPCERTVRVFKLPLEIAGRGKSVTTKKITPTREDHAGVLECGMIEVS